jgi:hypothetical protein
MNTNRLLIVLLLLGELLLTSCSPKLRVGALKTESQSVELGDAESVNVEIKHAAGDLQVDGGTEKLLEANFTYNVDKLKPEVEYADGTLVVREPNVKGVPALEDIADFRNKWDLRLNNEAPMRLRIDVGFGNSDLQLAGLWLTGLDISQGAGISTIDLSGNWERDLDATIEAGAANITVRLPKDVGVRIEVDAGPTSINAPGLTRNGNIYTNDAYGVSDVTLQIKMEAGVGQINLEEE